MSRLDLLADGPVQRHRMLPPVLGSALIHAQVRRCGASLHIYEHSQVNRRWSVDGVTYVNTAFGYPRETDIAAKLLLQVHGAAA